MKKRIIAVFLVLHFLCLLGALNSRAMVNNRAEIRNTEVIPIKLPIYSFGERRTPNR